MKQLKKFLFCLIFFVSFISYLTIACPSGTMPDCGHLEEDECGGHRFICGSGGNINCCKPCGNIQ